MQRDPVWALPRGLETFGVVLNSHAGVWIARLMFPLLYYVDGWEYLSSQLTV